MSFDAGQFDAALTAAEEALAMAEGNPRPLAALGAQAAQLAARVKIEGEFVYDQALPYVERGLVLARSASPPEDDLNRSWLLGLAVRIHWVAGAIPECEAALAEVLLATQSVMNHPAGLMPVVRTRLAHFEQGQLILASSVALCTGRIGVAFRQVLRAIASAESHRDRQRQMLGTVLAGRLACALGDFGHAGEITRYVDKEFSVDDLADTPPATIAETIMWQVVNTQMVFSAAGDFEAAEAVVVRALDGPLAGTDDHVMRSSLFLRTFLARARLRRGAVKEAETTFSELGLTVEEFLAGSGASEVLQLAVEIHLANGDELGVIEVLERHLAGEGQVPEPQLALQVFTLGSRSASVCRRHDTALEWAERATHAMRWLSGSGELETWRRASLLVSTASSRDICLGVAMAGRRHSPARSARLALEAANAWRENVLAAIVGKVPPSLPSDAMAVAKQITELCQARQVSAPIDAEGPTEAQTSAYRDQQLLELRNQLGHRLGTVYARFRVPIHDLATEPPEGTIWVSVTALPDTGGSRWICTAWWRHGRTPELVETVLPATVTGVLGELSRGLTPVDEDDVLEWQRRWISSRDGIADAIIPHGLRSVIEANPDSRVHLVLDGELSNVPVSALPLSEGRLLFEAALVSRGPLLWTLTQSFFSGGGVPKVLAYLYSDQPEGSTVASISERDILVELHRAGRLQVTFAKSLRDIPKLLAANRYDVLTLSSHGVGSGMEYHFSEATTGTELFAHEFLQVAVPPLVIAAACQSGTQGAVDIRGLLATLHARGAAEVISGNWDLPEDSTSALLTDLYGRLAQPGDATAKLTQVLRDRADPTNPYAWAGLVVNRL